MLNRFETDKLYTATVRNIYITESNEEKENNIIQSRRKAILYDRDGIMLDIMRPDEDLNECTYAHRVVVSDIEPLYEEGIHKVVSKRQAYMKYVSNKRKLTSNS